MANVPPPSPSLSLSHSLCVTLPLIRVSVPAPSLQAGVPIRSLWENGWSRAWRKRLWGEGKCSDTHEQKSLHIYIFHSCMLSHAAKGMPLHIHAHTYKHSMLVMTLIQLGPTKESDLSARITFPLSAVSHPSLSRAALCPLAYPYNPLHWVLSHPPLLMTSIGWLQEEINCDEYSGHTEETFAGKILISGTDLLKSQHTTIREAPLPWGRSSAELRVWLSCAGFSISLDS